MLVGIILLLSSVVLLGMDGDTVSVAHFPFVCQMRVWLLCCGFTLAFGAMFSKVWRVHRQSTKPKEDANKIKDDRAKSTPRMQVLCGPLALPIRPRVEKNF
jgi:gamma-aminobutyric acid type B receptor